MKTRSLLRRALSIQLCLALSGAAQAATPRTGAARSAPVLQAINAQLGALAAGRSSLAGADPLSDRALAQDLARTALLADSATLELAPQAEAARVVTLALANPASRERVAQALRRSGGELGAEAAGKLEALGGVSPSWFLKQLSQDVDAERTLAEVFDGRSGDAAGTEPISPRELVAYAQRRFAAGRLVPGDRLAVAAKTAPGVRPEAVPTDGEMEHEVSLSPLTNPERERVVIELFQQAGAKPAEIVVQDAGRGRHNIYVVKKGKGDRIIVVGGHHDKVSAGAGTIDNWTGATMVVNLYQAMREVDTDATYVFIAFAREEEGLLGSRYWLSQFPKELRAKIAAMVNLDTLGVDGTFSWLNNSTASLLAMIKRVAVETGLALVEAFLNGGDSDSTTFRRAGIPAMTIFGASEKVIWDIIHSSRDTMAAFSLPHYRNAFLLTLALIKKLDVEPVGRDLFFWWSYLPRWVRDFRLAA